jgi:3-hydroxyanthranilate 3,4-dioxygenase
MLNAFKAATELGSYDEFPVLVPGINPQVYLSRNTWPQPFFLVCERDCVLVQQAGSARVYFKDSSVLWHDLGPGDVAYVPAGTPHRFVPAIDSLVARYKAEPAGLEGVAWYCEACGHELDRVEWDTADELPQEGYLRACAGFNADERRRTCARCGSLHPSIDLDAFRWQAIAAELRSQAAPRPASMTTPAHVG